VSGEGSEVELGEELVAALEEVLVVGLGEELVAVSEVGSEEESAAALEEVLVELVLSQTQILHIKLELCIER
jgi:hypothetical protein